LILATSTAYQTCFIAYIGAGNEVYRTEIPEAFYSMTYEEIGYYCFMNPQLNLLLIAIDASPPLSHNAEPLIYPAPFGLTVTMGMHGYFIAQNEQQVLALKEVTPAMVIKQPVQHQDDVGLVQIEIQETTFSAHGNLHPPNLSTLYHKCPERSFENALLRESTNLINHIVLCTFSVKNSYDLNLHSFVSPLRSRTLQLQELKPIVIIGNKDCVQDEWYSIAEFDKVFVIDGSPLDQDTLKAANVAHCISCLILGSTTSLEHDQTLIDKQPILCSLTLSSLDFSGEVEPSGSMALTGKHVNKVTELYRQENVKFLDLGDDDDAASFIASQPFAQGECVSSTVFDSLVGVAYFNPGATALFEKLVTGGNMYQVKPVQKKRAWQLKYATIEEKPPIYQPCFLQISLEKPGYEKFQCQTFAKLFESLLKENKLCIGIYRRITSQDEFSKRYVITSPNHDLILVPTDNIFVLISFK